MRTTGTPKRGGGFGVLIGLGIFAVLLVVMILSLVLIGTRPRSRSQASSGESIEKVYSLQVVRAIRGLVPYYPRLRYDGKKERSLVFLDTRFKPFLEHVFVMFLASVDHTWNLTVLTPNDVWQTGYLPLLKRMSVEARHIEITPEMITPIQNYSEYLTSAGFYRQFPEKTILVFQSDSQAMGTFREEFMAYAYLGAPWRDGRVGT